MTGYGKAVVAYKEKKINVEIKSLNSKSLDVSTRIAPLPSKEHPRLISFRMDWLDLLSVQGTLKSLLHTSIHDHRKNHSLD